MASYADVFKRKEMKYVLSADQRLLMEDGCRAYMEVDAFGCSRVTSLYYDTPQRLLIERSLDKPLYKEKLRVRWYGEINEDGFPEPQTQVFVELKKKFKGIVYKRRLSCSFAAAQAFLGGEGYVSALNAYPLANVSAQEEAYAPRSLQIASEIEAFMARFEGLQPSMLITCKRTALTPRLLAGEAHDMSVQDDVRITFDEDILYRDIPGEMPSWQAITESSQAVMEIKVAGPYPRWLLDAVSNAEARPSSFSKYGQAYMSVQAQARAKMHAQDQVLCTQAVNQAVKHVHASESFSTPLHHVKIWIQAALGKKEKHYV